MRRSLSEAHCRRQNGLPNQEQINGGCFKIAGCAPLLTVVKNRIRAAQVKATLAANAELIHLYWDIGHAIAAMQEKEGWGAGVIPRLARDIANDMPEVKGFPEPNFKYMIRFAREYCLRPIVQQVAAQILWIDQVLHMAKARDLRGRLHHGRLRRYNVGARGYSRRTSQLRMWAHIPSRPLLHSAF